MQTPQSHRLRLGRINQPHRAYHLTTATHDRQPLLRNLQAGRIIVNALRHLNEQGQAETLAYVVMPDHLHWLMTLNPDSTLDGVMHSLKSYTAHRLKAHLKIDTPIWQSGYHDHAIRADEDLRRTARYLIANPLRAGLVTTIGDYPLWDAHWL
ncbi:MAG: transposase [Zoogloeaceae bacterium]|nr:transposase [Zoogloeaceae bacterium]